MKKLAALALAAALLLSPALAAGADPRSAPPDLSAWEEKFPADRTPPGFIDIEPGAWYEEAARICAQCGLMQGTGRAFDPGGTLTVGETAAIAARRTAGRCNPVSDIPDLLLNIIAVYIADGLIFQEIHNV